MSDSALDPQFSCVGAPAASPDRVILFPKLEVPQAAGNAYVMVHRMYVVGPALRVEIDGGRALAFITPDGTVKDLSFSDDYWLAHRALEASQKLTHSAEACPERTNAVDIRSWTAATSWRAYSIPQTEPARTPNR